MKDGFRQHVGLLVVLAVATLLTLDGCLPDMFSPTSSRTQGIAATATPELPSDVSVPTVSGVTPTVLTRQAPSTIASAAESSPASSRNVTVAERLDPKLGEILVDGMGRTLYRHSEDGPNASACAGRCAERWPPLIVNGTPALDNGVPGKLSVITRGDGSKQVTYNGIPLYYFARDHRTGDTTGQGIGGTWFVVAPGSTAETDDASSR